MPPFVFLVALFFFVVVQRAQLVEGIRSEFEMDWESGYPDGSPGLNPAMEPSFSLNQKSSVEGCTNSGGNEITTCKCGVDGYSPRNCDKYWGISSLHSQTLETVS